MSVNLLISLKQLYLLKKNKKNEPIIRLRTSQTRGTTLVSSKRAHFKKVRFANFCLWITAKQHPSKPTTQSMRFGLNAQKSIHFTLSLVHTNH